MCSVQLENFIQENVRSGMEEMKRTAVHTQTAAMLEMGTNLLSQSAEQTRKLTHVETQASGGKMKKLLNLNQMQPGEKSKGVRKCLQRLVLQAEIDTMSRAYDNKPIKT